MAIISACSAGIPSITYKGSLVPSNEVDPLTRIFTGSPGFAEAIDTWTPGAFPCKAEATFITGSFSRSAAPTEDTEPVKSLSRVVPYPTTTTSSSFLASGFKVKL